MKRYIVLRSSLIPYSYSNARVAYDEGIVFPQNAIDSSVVTFMFLQDLVCCDPCTMNFLKVQKLTLMTNRLLKLLLTKLVTALIDHSCLLLCHHFVYITLFCSTSMAQTCSLLLLQPLWTARQISLTSPFGFQK